jgi:hypothetical protein
VKGQAVDASDGRTHSQLARLDFSQEQGGGIFKSAKEPLEIYGDGVGHE